jgi:hypothetical protein
MDNEATSSLIELNVGGYYFTTTKTTLCRYDDSMLSLMVSGNYPTQKDSSGRLFIDRDGRLFSHILNYLRNNKLTISEFTDDSETSIINKLTNLKVEADFYRIDNLINDIENLLVTQKEKLEKLTILNENKFNYYQSKVQNAESSLKDNLDGYHLELVEHNFLNSNTKCLQIIAHYDVFKMLPLLKEDMEVIERAKQTISESLQSQVPHSISENRHYWYLGNDCFEIQNITYLTHSQLGHILLQNTNSKLIHSNIAYLNSVNNSTYNLSIFDKWCLPKDVVGKYLSNMCVLQQKALPPGRTVGYIDYQV